MAVAATGTASVESSLNNWLFVYSVIRGETFSPSLAKMVMAD